MVLAYDFPLATADLDGIFYQSEISEKDLQDEIHEIAVTLNIPKDWLNPYFSTFLYTLPKDYDSRLRQVYQGKKLTVQALGLEDLLILKCFAGREKDIGHARSLLKKGAKTSFVEEHILRLKASNIPKSGEALLFLQDLLDELGM